MNDPTIEAAEKEIQELFVTFAVEVLAGEVALMGAKHVADTYGQRIMGILTEHFGEAEECWMATGEGAGVAGSGFFDKEIVAHVACDGIFHDKLRHVLVRVTDVDGKRGCDEGAQAERNRNVHGIILEHGVRNPG